MATRKSKVHIVDDLDLLEIAKYKDFPLLPRESPLTTTASSSKNFIKKNIKQNSQYLALKKSI